MRPRQTVALPAPEADPRLLPAASLELALIGMLQVLILSNLNPFKMNTFTARPRFARSWCTANPLDATLVGTLVCVANKGLREIVSPLDATLTKNRGGVPTITSQHHYLVGRGLRTGLVVSSHAPLHLSTVECQLLVSRSSTGHGTRITSHVPFSFFLTSLPPYFLTSRRPPRAACYTVPAWHANASVNISSPISTGAKRSRAPSAFHRTPPCRSRTTISIAGSKLARVTAR